MITLDKLNSEKRTLDLELEHLEQDREWLREELLEEIAEIEKYKKEIIERFFE